MLRKKLQLAGLPDSVIKTIPRYGIRLVPYEPDVALPFVSGEGESLLSSSSNEKASLEDAAMDAFPETTSSHTEGKISAPLLPAETENMLKGPGIRHDKALIIIVTGILAGLVLILYLGILWVKPNPFPYQFKIDRVAFHLSSLRNEDQRTYLQLKGKLGKEVRHVYIASNGPKVWVASCENEIDDKEVKCRYLIHSVY
jgi:hypothetical protein